MQKVQVRVYQNGTEETVGTSYYTANYRHFRDFVYKAPPPASEPPASEPPGSEPPSDDLPDNPPTTPQSEDPPGEPDPPHVPVISTYYGDWNDSTPSRSTESLSAAEGIETEVETIRITWRRSKEVRVDGVLTETGTVTENHTYKVRDTFAVLGGQRVWERRSTSGTLGPVGTQPAVAGELAESLKRHEAQRAQYLAGGVSQQSVGAGSSSFLTQDTGKATSAAVPGGAGDTCIIADEFTMPLRGQCGFGGGGTAAMAMNNGLGVALSMAESGAKVSSYGDRVASENGFTTSYGEPKTGYNANGAHSEAPELSQSTAYYTGWGNPATLSDHFQRHGSDFGVTSEAQYAEMADSFFSGRANYQVKVDSEGVIRVYDSATNTFGSYNPDGTTRTFFKPSSPTYFDRQPGN